MLTFQNKPYNCYLDHLLHHVFKKRISLLFFFLASLKLISIFSQIRFLERHSTQTFRSCSWRRWPIYYMMTSSSLRRRFHYSKFVSWMASMVTKSLRIPSSRRATRTMARLKIFPTFWVTQHSFIKSLNLIHYSRNAFILIVIGLEQGERVPRPCCGYAALYRDGGAGNQLGQSGEGKWLYWCSNSREARPWVGYASKDSGMSATLVMSKQFTIGNKIYPIRKLYSQILSLNAWQASPKVKTNCNAILVSRW